MLALRCIVWVCSSHHFSCLWVVVLTWSAMKCSVHFPRNCDTYLPDLRLVLDFAILPLPSHLRSARIDRSSTLYPSQSDVSRDNHGQPFNTLARILGGAAGPCTCAAAGCVLEFDRLLSLSCARFTLLSQFRLRINPHIISRDLGRITNSACPG